MGEKRIVPPGIHMRGVAVHDWQRRDVKVAEHGIGFPTTHQLDGVGVDASTKKGGSTASTQAAGFNILRLEVHGSGTQEGDTGSKSFGEHFRSDVP